jgi:hypothetical protein
MQVEGILDDLPTTQKERAELIEHLLQMIERLSQSIQRHESYTEGRDQLAIDQFTERRGKYVGQLALLLSQYGLTVQLPIPPANAEEQQERADFRAAAHAALNRAYGDNEPDYDDRENTG